MTKPVGPSVPATSKAAPNKAQGQADAKFLAEGYGMLAEDMARVAELVPGVKVSGLSVTVKIGKDEAKVVKRGPATNPLASYPTAQEAKATEILANFSALKKTDPTPLEAKAWGIVTEFLEAGLRRGASADEVQAAARKGLAGALKKNPEAQPFVDAALARVAMAYEMAQ